MKLTQKQIALDATWKQVYRAMSYLVARYGHSEDEAISLLNSIINAIRRELSCAS